MPLSAVSIPDIEGNPVGVATRLLSSLQYQMMEPEILTYHRVSAGSGDAVSISAVPVVVRAVRAFNKDTAVCFVKLHDAASAPTVGAGVAYAVGVQAGTANPDPRLSGGGKAFAVGLGLSIVREVTDAGTTGVTAASVLVEIEYHLA